MGKNYMQELVSMLAALSILMEKLLMQTENQEQYLAIMD